MKTAKLFGFEPGVRAWLDREPETASNWIVDNLMYRGTIAMLDGMGSSGKSYIALQLSLSIASGLPFLGVLPVQRGRVLVLNGEDPESITHARFRNIAQNYVIEAGEDRLCEASKNITYISMSQIDTNSIILNEKMQPTATYQELMRFCQEWKPDLIVIDPLIMFVADENKSSYAMQFYLALRKLNSTILILHHNNKSAMDANSTIEDRAKARGSSVWTENAKTRMYLKGDTICVEKNNFSTKGKCRIKLNFEGGMWFSSGIEYDKDNAQSIYKKEYEAASEDEIKRRGRKRKGVADNDENYI